MQKNQNLQSELYSSDTDTKSVSFLNLAQYLLKWISHDEMKSIINNLQLKDSLIREDLLYNIIDKEVTHSGASEKIKEFLMKNGAISQIFSDQIVNKKLSRYYVSNISMSSVINEVIIKNLEHELLKILPTYRNRSTSGVSIFNLRRDYDTYLAGGSTFESDKEQIHKGVIVASLYDALLCRKEFSEKLINTYFSDHQQSRYSIISGTAANTIEDISKRIHQILDKMEALTKPIKTPVIKTKSKAISDWDEVYLQLSKNPATLNVRKAIAGVMDAFTKTDNVIDKNQFETNIKDLAQIFMNTFDIDKVKQPEYKSRIIKTIQYLYFNDLEVYGTIKDIVEKEKFDQILIDGFIFWVVEISIKVHQEILNKIMKRHNYFFYLFIRSYLEHKQIYNSKSLESFFKIFKKLFSIKHSDTQILRSYQANSSVFMI